MKRIAMLVCFLFLLGLAISMLDLNFQNNPTDTSIAQQVLEGILLPLTLLVAGMLPLHALVRNPDFRSITGGKVIDQDHRQAKHRHTNIYAGAMGPMQIYIPRPMDEAPDEWFLQIEDIFTSRTRWICVSQEEYDKYPVGTLYP